MKYHVVFPAEEKNVALRRAELAAKSLCELNGGEASTDNDYSYWVHLLAPIARLETAGNFGLLMGSSHYCDAAREHFDVEAQDSEPRVAPYIGNV